MASPRPRPIQFPTRRRALPINQQTMAVAGLALIAIVLAALIAHDFIFPPATNTAASVRTATVSLGTVRSAVTATGTLVPAQQLNVGFKTAGTLTEVDVRVGDHVTAGQVLAKLDPTQLQLALDQANASLQAAQANLANAENGASIVQAQHQLAQAQTNYQNALNNLNADTNTLNADQNTLNGDSGNYWYQQYGPTLTNFQNEINAGQAEFRSQNCSFSTNYDTAPPPYAPNSCADAQYQISQGQAGVSCIQSGIGATCTPQEQQIASAYKAVQADQGRVSADQGKVNADNAQVQSAAFQVTSAQDSYNSQAGNRPGQIASAQASVAGAQAQVNTAQANLNSAVLTAPTDGVIGSVNGGPGDAISATATTAVAQAPGSAAPLPSSSGSSSSASGSSGGGGSAFITLLNTTAYQAVVTFAESDATKLQNGQAGTLSFDALPSVTIPVHVLAVAPAATVVSNVVNYYATLTLDSLNSALRAGLTANATIVTSQASNVLTVPNSAITRFGQNAFVTVLGANGVQTRVPVQLGVQGDTTTAVTSGLQAGDKVVLPQLRSSTSTAGGTRGLGGGGFGGGGGVIGGGGRGG